MSDRPARIRIKEEGPREGFQIESPDIPTVRKIELVDALSDTGLARIQVASFVNPKRVPGMADADAVVRGFRKRPGVEYSALWLNARGFERALELSDRLAVKGALPLCASAAFLKRNQNRTMEENTKALHDIVRMYQENDVPVHRGSVMAAFGCNFEGDIAPSRVVEMVRQIFAIADQHDLDINEIALADTMGWANPLSIRRVVGAVRDAYPDVSINLHLHDTRGLGLANVFAGLEMGVDDFDTSVAGLGGCPFARHEGAAGNVCTEDLVFMCSEMGIETGIDLERLIDVARLAEDIVGHRLPGHVMRGGALEAMRDAVRTAA